jgi:PAS domain S-box-containing protein
MSEFSATIDGSEVAAASMDGVGIVSGGEYADANDVLADVHGYERPEELVGREWERLYSTAEAPAAAELLAHTREEGDWRGCAFAHSRTGDRVPVELSMRTTGDDVVCVVRDVAGQELDRYETIVNTVRDGVYVLDESFRFSFVNRGLCELTELTREELVGRPVTDLFEYEDELAAVREVRRRVLDGDTSIGTMQGTLETSEGRRTLEARFRLHPEPDGEFRGSIGVVRDVTDREERERRLERQRDELDTLNRINELLLAVVRSLFESSTDGDIEQTVCSRLADSDLYQFAWIGKPEVGGDRLVPDASAGVDGGYIESITVTTDESETGRGPGGRAFRTGEVQVSQDVRTDPSFEPWRRAAVDHDVRSAAAIPLTHDGTTYGILAVYAARPLGFSSRERRGFEILAEAVGYAINAGKTRRLLHAESVSELEFDLAGAETFLFEAAADLGCSISCDSYVAVGSGDWLLYLTVTGDGADRFVDAAAQDERVLTVTPIESSEAGLSVGLTTASSLLDTITAAGGNLTAASIESGAGRITVEVPQSTDIRRFVAQVQTTCPNATLVSLTTHERSVTGDTWPTEDRGLTLTDRQRQALEAAFRAGYFQWPRDSSAEEVAALLDVSRPTFQAHLRKAENELLTAFFDTSEHNSRGAYSDQHTRQQGER